MPNDSSKLKEQRNRIKELFESEGRELSPQREKEKKFQPPLRKKPVEEMTIQEHVDNTLNLVERGLERDIAKKGVYYISPDLDIKIEHNSGAEKPFLINFGDEDFAFYTHEQAEEFLEQIRKIHKEKAQAILDMIDFILNYPDGIQARKFKAAVSNMIVGIGHSDPRNVSMDFGVQEGHNSLKLPGWARETKLGKVYALTTPQLSFISSMYTILKNRDARAEQKEKEFKPKEISQKDFNLDDLKKNIKLDFNKPSSEQDEEEFILEQV